MGGRGPLPFAGGMAEQPAALMVAIQHVLSVYGRLRAADREAAREGRG